MKTSKAYFNRFRKEFQRWQGLLGLTQYRVYFEHKPLNGAWARLYVQEQDKVATATLTTEVARADVGSDDGPEAHAKHEAIHLLLHRMEFLGQERYTASDEIHDEAEAIVNRLERVLL
jgi:hypothetical protein